MTYLQELMGNICSLCLWNLEENEIHWANEFHIIITSYNRYHNWFVLVIMIDITRITSLMFVLCEVLLEYLDLTKSNTFTNVHLLGLHQFNFQINHQIHQFWLVVFEIHNLRFFLYYKKVSKVGNKFHFIIIIRCNYYSNHNYYLIVTR